MLTSHGSSCPGSTRSLQAAWNLKIEGGQFPLEAVAYVKKEYYESSKAKQLMECFVFDSGNLHQTTTSCNEGSHAAFRSKISVIPKPAESYKQRRIHKQQWLQRLRSAAMRARNRIPLDIQRIPELSQIVRKTSIFALTEIKKELIAAKKDASQGIRSCGQIRYVVVIYSIGMDYLVDTGFLWTVLRLNLQLFRRFGDLTIGIKVWFDIIFFANC